MTEKKKPKPWALPDPKSCNVLVDEDGRIVGLIEGSRAGYCFQQQGKVWRVVRVIPLMPKKWAKP